MPRPVWPRILYTRSTPTKRTRSGHATPRLRRSIDPSLRWVKTRPRSPHYLWLASAFTFDLVEESVGHGYQSGDARLGRNAVMSSTYFWEKSLQCDEREKLLALPTLSGTK